MTLMKSSPLDLVKHTVGAIIDIGLLTIVDNIVMIACPSLSKPIRVCVALTEAAITMAAGEIIKEKVTDPIIDIVKESVDEVKAEQKNNLNGNTAEATA